jgi:hypothetical protein
MSSKITPYTYNSLEKSILMVFAKYSGALSDEARNHIGSMIEASELEMACESLVLSLIDEMVPINMPEKKLLSDISRELNLEHSSVFKHDFWAYASMWWYSDN